MQIFYTRKGLLNVLTGIVFLAVMVGCKKSSEQQAIYTVSRADGPVKIDANWEKGPWQNVPELEVNNILGESPGFIPKTVAKIIYDAEYIYVIFRVEDKFVRALPRRPNDEVWKDSCVEFFFAPDEEQPLYYFNLEVNCGGVPLMKYTTAPRKEFVTMGPDDFDMLEIAHSMPEVVDPEEEGPLTWTVEYKIPLQLLKKYSKISTPASGVIWKANFYKIAEISSNPHYITWSEIRGDEVSFHKPEYFGSLRFE